MKQAKLDKLLASQEKTGLPIKLIGANLAGLSFRGACLIGATFKHCIATETAFTYAELRDATFIDCIMDYAVFANCDLNNTTIAGCSLDHVLFAAITAESISLIGSTGRHTSIVDAILTNPSLHNTRLTNPTISNVRLTDPILTDFAIDEGTVGDLTIEMLDLIHNTHRRFAIRDADMSNVVLKTLRLSKADFSHTRMTDVVIENCKLQHTNLAFASMSRVEAITSTFTDTALLHVEVCGSELPEHLYNQQTIAPAGTLIVYKCLANRKIAKLLIPRNAERTSAGGRKCRASCARILSITDHNGGSYTQGFSTWDPDFIYRVGTTVRPSYEFDTDIWAECSPGIHFFLTETEAVEYGTPC